MTSFWGCVSQVGEQTFNIGRNAALAAGWPETVPGTTIDRQCGSSQQAVHFAAADRDQRAGRRRRRRRRGVDEPRADGVAARAHGAGTPLGPKFLARYEGVYPNQGVGAEMIAERWGFSRTQLDEFSLGLAREGGQGAGRRRFDEEIAPVTTPDGAVVSADEGIRPGGTLEKLAALKTPFKEDGVISAGNASQISDGVRGPARDHEREGPRARADADRADPHDGHGRRRPGHHADRARSRRRRRCWPGPGCRSTTSASTR